MAMVVNTNVSSLIAQSAANATNKSLDTAMERLATGKRINSAADDAAGVAIASRLEAEIRGVNQAVRNAADAQAMIDTAEGAHIEITNILQRMREIAVQSSNDSNNNTDRGYLQNEVDALANEVDRIANTSTWAGKNLIKTASSFNFLLGSEKADNEITVSTNAMTGAALGIKAGNALVGAQGATLTEVGETVLQVGGVPAANDVYEFDLNGENIKVKLLADDGGATTHFDYQVSLNSAAYGAKVDGAGSDGKGIDAVAKYIAAYVNTTAITNNHPGMSATTNADGSVTFAQDIAVTGGYDTGGTPVLIAAQSADVTGVTLAPGASGATTFEADGTPGVETYKITGEAAYGDAKVTKFIINGTDEISVTGTQLATAGYAKTSVGAAAYIQSQLDAKTDLKGLTFRVGSKANDVYIEVTEATSGTGLLANEKTTPAATSNALAVNTQASAANAINTIDTALDLVNSQRAALGAVSNRMDSAISNLTNMSVNLAGGKSRIEDADFAAETAQLTKSQILQQAATSMLAQANASKQSVLSLLQG